VSNNNIDRVKKSGVDTVDGLKIGRQLLSSDKADVFLRRLLMILGSSALVFTTLSINKSIRRVVELDDGIKGVVEQSNEKKGGRQNGDIKGEEGELGDEEALKDHINGDRTQRKQVDLSEFQGKEDLRSENEEGITLELKEKASLDGREVDGEYELTPEDVRRLKKVHVDKPVEVKGDEKEKEEECECVPREVLEEKKAMVRNVFVENFQQELIDKYMVIDTFSPQDMRDFYEDFLLHIEAARIVAEEVGEDYDDRDLFEAKVRAVKVVDKLREFVDKHSERIGVDGSVIDRAKKISGLINSVPYLLREAYPTNLFNSSGSAATNCNGKSIIASMVASRVFEEEIKQGEVEVTFESMRVYMEEEQEAIAHIRLALITKDNDLVVDVHLVKAKKDSLKTWPFEVNASMLLGEHYSPIVEQAYAESGGIMTKQLFTTTISDPEKIITWDPRNIANLEEVVSDNVTLEEVEEAFSFFSKDMVDIKKKSRDNVDFKRRLKKMLIEKMNSFAGNLDLSNQTQRSKFKSIDTLMEYYLFRDQRVYYNFKKMRVVGSSVEDNKFVSQLHSSHVDVDYYPKTMLGLFDVPMKVDVYMDEVTNPYVFDGVEDLKFLWKIHANKLNAENVTHIPLRLQINGEVGLDVWKLLATVEKERTISVSEIAQVNLNDLTDVDLSKVSLFLDSPKLNSTVLGLNLKELRIWGEKGQLEFILDNLDACRFEVLFLYDIIDSDIDVELLKKIAKKKKIVFLTKQESMSEKNRKKVQEAVNASENIGVREW